MWLFWEYIFSPYSMGRFTFNIEHHQQRRCMTCLKIYWIEVLFKLCLIYMLLVAATQLVVSKENVPLKSIFSQREGLPIISSFAQQKLY